MANDKPTFPGDPNGAVLRRLWELGDDLSKPREFEFGVAFEHEEVALNFAVALLKRGMKVSFCHAEEGNYYCEVQCYTVMIPDHTEISNFEASLSEIAEEFGGDLDGWDCFVMRGVETDKENPTR
jgi:Regulator of ribonuclease activity B